MLTGTLTELAQRAILNAKFCQLTTRVLQKKKNKWLFLDNSSVSAQESVDQLWQELDHHDCIRFPWSRRT